ncbi:MAG: CocE/NonD family hydrolase [Calditrichaeota bacterium]|nr:CocE/NonD family hydrolase [Calditrichota bacterium]
MKYYRVARAAFLLTLPVLLFVNCERAPEDTAKVRQAIEAANTEELSQPVYDIIVEENVMVEMRDGIRLRTEVYRPDAPGTFPVILKVTPYEGDKSEAEEFAKRGYVYIYQYARGRLGSEGFFYPYVHVREGEDAFDALQWIASQPWCNGKAGMCGVSAEAFCQFAVGVIGHPILRAMVPLLPVTEVYDEYYRQGAYGLPFTHWAAEMYAPYGWDRELLAAKFDSINRSIPLIDQDKIIGWPIPLIRDMVSHPAYDTYWRKINLGNRLKEIEIPTYIVSGWFDLWLLPCVLKTYTIMTEPDVPQGIKRNKRLIIGPWAHAPDQDGVQGDIDFGKDGVFLFNYERFSLPWFDYYLKGKRTFDIDTPPIRLFVMGDNEWRDEHEWPLARTRFEKYYFQSNGRANSLRGNGSMSTHLPQQEPSDHFLYDPLHPVPSYPDTSRLSFLGRLRKLAPSDHSRLAEREDVLVYTSGQLHNDIEVTGPVKVILYASSSAKTTDFTAKLCDVYPDGRSIRLCEGIIRATHRNGPEKLSFIERGKVYEYNIDLLATSNVFKKDHRIRVEISSSNFPRFDRNLNTALNNALATEMVQAEQTIYHNEEYPSHIVLPVIPR